MMPVHSKTQRPLIKIKSIKGMEHKWLFNTGAGLTCMSLIAFRSISKYYRPLKINTIGKSAKEATGSTVISEWST
jgi:hypothetical protein